MYEWMPYAVYSAAGLCAGGLISALVARSRYLRRQLRDDIKGLESALAGRDEEIQGLRRQGAEDQRRIAELEAALEKAQETAREKEKLVEDVKRRMTDSLDLVRAVNKGIETLSNAIVAGPQPPRLAKVDATDQLAHDQDIQPGNHLGAQR